MSATPYQTYLEERLQSARGLGWNVSLPAPRGDAVDALITYLGPVLPKGRDGLLWPNLRRWLASAGK